MNKNYIVVFVGLLVFFLVVFTTAKLTEKKSEYKDVSSNYNYHIIYYDYNSSAINKETKVEEDSDEDFGDYYDDPFEDEGDIEAAENEEIYLPINIYKKGKIIYVTKEYKDKCDNEPCETKTTNYNINFSENGQLVVDNFITTKFNNSNITEVTLYKDNISSMEEKIIKSIINNDESYLAS